MNLEKDELDGLIKYLKETDDPMAMVGVGFYLSLIEENQKLKAQVEAITKVFKEAMDRLWQYNTHKDWVEDELEKIEEMK